MPDTGAPWNIPYVAGTDLVSDWPTDSQSLATAIASGLDAAGNAGIGTNVVQTVKDTEFSTTSSTFVDVTGLSATITPTSATSKVLVIANITHTAVVSAGSQGSALIRLNGGGADVYVGAGTGAAAMSRNLNVTGASFLSAGNNFTSTVVYLISPATTSPVTIDTQMRVYFSTGKVCPDNGLYGQTPSSLTLIEVAA